MQTETAIQVCESLTTEHRQMEKLLESLELALHCENFSSVRLLMRWIETNMNTHFACEELALFPVVAPYHPMVLMEVEHEELIDLRDLLLAFTNQEASEAIWSSLKETGKQFIQEMRNHISREDAGIFPTCERALSENEKRTVLARMAHIRSESKIKPTPSIARPERSFQVLQATLNAPAEKPISLERLFDAEETEIKHLTITAGNNLAAHWSPKQITLISLQGTGFFKSREQDTAVTPGTVILISPQLQYAFQAQTDCHLLLIFRPVPDLVKENAIQDCFKNT